MICYIVLSLYLSLLRQLATMLLSPGKKMSSGPNFSNNNLQHITHAELCDLYVNFCGLYIDTHFCLSRIFLNYLNVSTMAKSSFLAVVYRVWDEFNFLL